MAKDSLFELIQSMSKSEKRYFKLNSATHTNKNSYVKMFDQINAQKKHKEKWVKDKSKKIINPNKFAVEKNYLYNSLLKSLTSFHNQKSLNSKASTSLFTIKMLIDKALYIQAKKLIDKNQKFAEQSENYTLLLEILKLKIVYQETIMDNEGINDTYQRVFEVQKIYTNLEQFRFYHHKIYDIATKIGEKKRSVLFKEAGKIISESLLKDEKMALSNEAKIRFNECWMLYYYLEPRFEKAFNFSKRSVEISEKTPYYTSEKKDNYISNLNNYVIFCNGLSKYAESKIQIQKLKSFLTKDANSKSNINIFIGTSLQETNLIIITANFDQLYDIIDDYETYLNLFEDKIVLSHKYGLFINLSLLFFINTDYKNALKWINKIIHGDEPNTRTDVTAYAWLFNLIIHYELDNHDYLEYLTKTTIRLLTKKNQFSETAKVLSSHLLKLTSDNPGHKKIYLSLNESLNSNECANEKKELEYFDIENWVKSKIENKSLKTILKEIDKK
jgi:hypothetical protein